MTEKDRDKPEKKECGLVVLSGPSGSGKTTICRVLAKNANVTLAVSATTRRRRPGEIHGKDYYFMTREMFEERIERGDFIEYNEVFKNNVLYGSLKEDMEKGLSCASMYYLMEIDVVGALNLKRLNYEGLYVFIAPPSMEELNRRLSLRGTDNSRSVAERMKKAEWEMDQAEHYDLVVVNDDLEKAQARVAECLGLELNDQV